MMMMEKIDMADRCGVSAHSSSSRKVTSVAKSLTVRISAKD